MMLWLFLLAGSLIFPHCSGRRVLGRKSLRCALLESWPAPPSGKPSHGAHSLIHLGAFIYALQGWVGGPQRAVVRRQKRHVLATRLFLHQIINRGFVTSRHTQAAREGHCCLDKCDGQGFPISRQVHTKITQRLKISPYFKMLLPRESDMQFCPFGDNPHDQKLWCAGLLSHINRPLFGMRLQPGVPVSSQTEQEK